MRVLYLSTIILCFLLHFVLAEIFTICENITLQWELTGFSQGNLLVNKEPGTQNRTGTFHLACDNVHVNNLTTSGIFYNGTSVNFRIQQVDVYSDQNECYLEYCLIRPSNEQCTNYKMCNFTLPVVYLALYNISEKSLLLQWTPVSQQTGDLIISNYKKDTKYQYEILCDGFEVVNYTFVLEVSSSTNETFKFLKVSLKLNENTSRVEQYQCLVRLCANTEQEDVCDHVDYYHMIIPDVINERIAQRPNVFYHYWQKPSTAVELRVTGNQLNCDNITFHWLTDHDNQGQLIVHYIPSAMAVRKGNFTVNCNAMKTAISDVLIQPYVEVTLIFPFEYFHNTVCLMDICLIGDNNSCIEGARCDVKLDKSYNSTNDTVIQDSPLSESLNYTINQSNSSSFNDTILQLKNESSAIVNYCHQLKFKWMPKDLDHGNLLVTKRLDNDYENQSGNYSLTCENAEVVDPVISLIPLYPLSARHTKITMEFSLRLVDVYKEQNDCSLQICILTKPDYSNCMHSIQCNVTLPVTSNVSNNTNAEPIVLQWVPVDDEMGHLIISNYNEEEGRQYQYEVLCDGFGVENYTFALKQSLSNEASKLLQVSLILNNNTSMVEQYQCLVQVCNVNRRINMCNTYHITIPDIDITNRRILYRPDLFYHHWQKPNFTVELQTTGSCDNVKLYMFMKNSTQGELILSFTPSAMSMVRGKSNFRLKCRSGGTRTKSEITDVLIQPYVDVTMKFLMEHYSINSLCHVKICTNINNTSNQCFARCSFRWILPEPARQMSNNKLINDTTPLSEGDIPGADHDDNVGPCTPNTWLWMVDNGEEGEAHIVIGDDVLNNTDKSNGKISLSCTNLTVVSTNPQPIQFALVNGGVASFVVQSTGSSERFQDCIFSICSAETNNSCEMIHKCYITIPLRQGAFQLSEKSQSTETCPQSLWRWRNGADGGQLSIKYRTERKEIGNIGIHCTGIKVKGRNRMSNTDIATFTLVNSTVIPLNLSSPYCNVHVCVKHRQYIGCKKSLDCVLTIPITMSVSRVARSNEEPSEESLQDCEQDNLESHSMIPSCSEKTWDIFYTTGYAEGEVSLQINLQGNDEINEFLKVSIYCSGLDLRGSTEYRLIIPKTLKEKVVEFNISLPKSSNEEPQTYHCTLLTQRRPISVDSQQENNTMCPTTMSCRISVKTVLGRILPKCNVTEGRNSIQQIDIKHDQARVEITVYASPNNVYTVDPYCNKNNPFGHNTSEELLINSFPSIVTEEGQVTIAIAFQPECDNKTVASYFANKRLEDCHMDLYWYCQGGEQLLQSINNLQFSDEPMYCEPQSIGKTLLLSIQRSFGVYSESIAILLTILVGVAGLYVLLIPAIITASYYNCKKNRLVPGTNIECKHTGDVDSTDSLTLDKEITAVSDDLPSSAAATPPLSSVPAPPPPPPLLSLSSPPQRPLIPAPPPPPRRSLIPAPPPRPPLLLLPVPPPPPRSSISIPPPKSLAAAPSPSPQSSVPAPPPPPPLPSIITPQQRGPSAVTPPTFHTKHQLQPITSPLLHHQSPLMKPIPPPPPMSRKHLQKSKPPPPLPRDTPVGINLPTPLIPSPPTQNKNTASQQ